VDIIDQLLGSIRQDETGAPPEAMDRMRWTVQATTLQARDAGPDVVTAGAHRADDPTAALATVRAARAPARRRAVLVAGIAAGLAVAVAGTAVLVNRGPDPAAPARQAVPPPRHQGVQPQAPAPLPEAKDLPTLLRNAATAAGRGNVAPRPDQFIFSERRAVDWTTHGRPAAPGRYWASVDGSRPNVVEDTDKLGHRDRILVSPNTDPSLGNPTYTFLTTLPTDPAALRAVLVAGVNGVAGTGKGKVPDKDQYMFETIGTLLQTSVLPPRLAGTLYRLASQIHGVRLERDAVDAVGRHGIGAVRFSAATPGYGQEWIFNPRTFGLIGFKMWFGDGVFSSIAITKVAVVDRAPAGAKPLATPTPIGAGQPGQGGATAPRTPGRTK
jgi:hypothetical protein